MLLCMIMNKVLEKQEEEDESNYSEVYARLQLEISELEKMIQINDAVERLNSAKMVFLVILIIIYAP